MEFSSKSRSNAPGLSSPTSFANFVKQQKLGLLILASIPHSQTHIVFSTRNLTKAIVETNAALSSMSNLDDISDKSSSAHVAVADDQGTPGTGHSFTKPLVLRKPCVLSSNYMSQRNDSLPLTTCVKHGTAGFLPLDYARTLPEYTCTTQIFPVHRVVHTFDDCVLEFPDTTTTQTQIRQETNVMNKCSRCEKELTDRDDIYMFRDNMFCSNECRNEVSTVCFSCATRDHEDDDDDDDDDDDEFSDASSMEYGETIFTIDYFT